MKTVLTLLTAGKTTDRRVQKDFVVSGEVFQAQQPEIYK